MSDLGREIQTVGSSARAIDNSGSSWEGGLWFEQLQPGSWRGVGFVMDAAATTTGRRIAMHEYPYRDTVWPEDLGKLPRQYVFRAYLTGDDVYQQRDRMMAACERAGAGTLVHPTLGSLTVVLLNASFTDQRDRGRYIEVAFSFVNYSDSLQPAAVTSTKENVTEAAGALDGAAAKDLSRSVNEATTTSIPDSATDFVDDFTRRAVDAVNDPGRALSAVTGLQGGLFGRYSNGRRSTLQPITTTVAGALAESASSRETVLVAAEGLTAAVGALA